MTDSKEQFTQPFEAKRVVRTYTQHIIATPEKVFPLLCPVREMEWLDGWTYEMIYSESGIAEKGCVFKNKLAGDVDTIWVISSYDPPRYIEFVRITPDAAVVQFDIKLRDNGDGTTDAEITYTFTGLTEAGNAYVESFANEKFIGFMSWWEKAMNHYIQTGEMLKR